MANDASSCVSSSSSSGRGGGLSIGQQWGRGRLEGDGVLARAASRPLWWLRTCAPHPDCCRCALRPLPGPWGLGPRSMDLTGGRGLQLLLPLGLPGVVTSVVGSHQPSPRDVATAAAGIGAASSFILTPMGGRPAWAHQEVLQHDGGVLPYLAIVKLHPACAKSAVHKYIKMNGRITARRPAPDT